VLQELKRSREEIGFLSEELQRKKAPQGLVGLLGCWKLANRQMPRQNRAA
jgi:predicted ThiF/HesA family dinucleotide-utilizing enzyme